METLEINTVTVADFFPFKPVNDVNCILSVLKSRLPVSSSMYNMAIFCKDSLENNTLFYTFQPEENNEEINSFWIVAVYHRIDLGNRYSISAPPVMVITDRLKEAFVNSSLFNWNEDYSFVALERRVSALIVEISVTRFGNSIKIAPTKVFICDPSDVMSKEDKIQCYTKEELKVSELKSDEESLFLCQNWNFATSKTFEAIKKLLGETESVGIYFKGELVSGVIITESGSVGMLHTLKEHRGKGFANIAMKHLLKKVLLKGGYPCSCAEIKNHPSIAFHTKLGMTFSHFGDYIYHSKLNY